MFDSILLESNYRGEKSLRECLCDLIYKFCNVRLNPNQFILHHINGDHSDNSIDNLALLPTNLPDSFKNPNSHLHGLARGKNRPFTLDKTDIKYLNELAKLKSIDVWISILNRRLSNCLDIEIKKEDLLIFDTNKIEESKDMKLTKSELKNLIKECLREELHRSRKSNKRIKEFYETEFNPWADDYEDDDAGTYIFDLVDTSYNAGTLVRLKGDKFEITVDFSDSSYDIKANNIIDAIEKFADEAGFYPLCDLIEEYENYLSDFAYGLDLDKDSDVEKFIIELDKNYQFDNPQDGSYADGYYNDADKSFYSTILRQITLPSGKVIKLASRDAEQSLLDAMQDDSEPSSFDPGCSKITYTLNGQPYKTVTLREQLGRKNQSKLKEYYEDDEQFNYNGYDITVYPITKYNELAGYEPGDLDFDDSEAIKVYEPADEDGEMPCGLIGVELADGTFAIVGMGLDTKARSRKRMLDMITSCIKEACNRNRKAKRLREYYLDLNQLKQYVNNTLEYYKEEDPEEYSEQINYLESINYDNVKDFDLDADGILTINYKDGTTFTLDNYDEMYFD